MHIFYAQQAALYTHRQKHSRTAAELTIAELTAKSADRVAGQGAIGRSEANFADIRNKRQADRVVVANTIALNRHDLFAELDLVLE